nr:DUF3106 domain-containing protein [Pseudoxanthomonas sp.]
MKTRYPRVSLLSLLCLGLLWAGQALAQQAAPAPAPLPEWDKLTPQQREILIAPLRDRWNSDPASRPRMLEHGRRWQQMTPEQRSQARRGMHRFEHMNPEQRDRARALFLRMREMPPEQREKLRDDWKKMTPEQRRTWLEQHRPKDDAPRP